jgi:hypothetical protein
MNNETGFFLPYVLFITTLLFIVITASIKTYQQDTYLTHHYLDQLRAETIVQIGLTKFKEDYLPNEETSLKVNYNFLDGDVTIVYHLINEVEYKLHFTVLTKEGTVYTTIHTLTLAV